MSRFGTIGSICLSLLVSGVFPGTGVAQQSPDFAGNWVLGIGQRVFIELSLTQPSQGQAYFGGVLIRPLHFSSGGGGSFSKIQGPVTRYPIVRSTVRDRCLSFTVQNPSDKTDEDNFQFCSTEKGRGTLKFDFPGIEPWPMTKEKGVQTVATDWDSARTYYLDDNDVSSSEMQRISEGDQKDRQAGIGKIDWSVVDKADAARREATAKLLADGKLHTGEDFERAAFVFQHGDTPSDYLLAHTLAMVAVARGKSSALWIAAATLDRYLHSIHQPQIYGTQFFTPPHQPTTQEPYDRALVPDALRRSLDVPSQAMQEEQRKHYDEERSSH